MKYLQPQPFSSPANSQAFRDNYDAVFGRGVADPPPRQRTQRELTEEQAETFVERFCRLRDQWLRETKYVSSTTEMSIHPAYQQIIGMGPSIVPLLLHELEEKLEHWFWALHAITGEDPVAPADRSDVRKMAHAWLEWGRSRGIL